jgi:hypothetical protein
MMSKRESADTSASLGGSSRKKKGAKAKGKNNAHRKGR